MRSSPKWVGRDVEVWMVVFDSGTGCYRDLLLNLLLGILTDVVMLVICWTPTGLGLVGKFTKLSIGVVSQGPHDYAIQALSR